MQQNALSAIYSGVAGAPPQFDLVGPTIDDDVRRIVNRYGYKAVRDAVKRATVQKRGRKAERDWPELSDVMKAHAREWLSGGDPFASYSNYAIAQAYVAVHPGHNPVATLRRLMRKLAKSRTWITLANAVTIGAKEYPHEAYLRALQELIRQDESQSWVRWLSFAQKSIEDYTQKFGKPEPDLTMDEIEERSRHVLVSAALNAPRQGLLGGGGLSSLVK